MLWQCLDDAGIDRADVFVTNAVKHFKHEDRGKRRLHKKPNTAEVEACHPWIDAELRAVRARVIVALGATAARSLVRTQRCRSPPAGADDSRRRSAGDRSRITPRRSCVPTSAAAEIRAALVADLRRANELAASMPEPPAAGALRGRLLGLVVQGLARHRVPDDTPAAAMVRALRSRCSTPSS